MKDHTCFHCGLPVTDKKPATLIIDGTQQLFCCHGCKTVCEFIIDSGNADYYKYRDTSARTFDESELPRLLDNLKLYDKEEIQREFIRSQRDGDWNEVWLILDEIRCAACMWLNERTLYSLEGVLEVQMDYTGQQARVRWDPDKIKLSEILSAITNIGYYAHPFDPSQRESLNTEQKQRSMHRIIFALVLGMLVMQSSIGAYFYGEADAQGNYPLWMTISRWANVFVCLSILAYPGQLFFRNAWRDLKNRTLGMDVPIVIGLTAAWTGSLYNTIRGSGEVYFESIAMFVIFLLVARHIELRSRITATALLDRTAKIIPQTVTLFADNGYKEVAAIELKRGDRIQVSPGETLAVDGILRSSSSSFDESLLSGESLPVTYKEGDHVPGGAINVDQVIEVEVLAGKADSLLNEIHQLTQRSVSFRPRYVDIAENVAGVFVATILSIATLTYLFWYWRDPELALSHTIAVLIVTCPCALALAAPVSLTLGAAGLNKLHILPVRMSAIEKLAHVDTIVFDKTGTLTSGKPVVDSIHVLGDRDKNFYMNIAACLEHGSHHPFAKAICEAALSSTADSEITKPSFEIDQSRQFPGQGVEALIRSEGYEKRWRLGNEKFVLSEVNDLPASITTEIAKAREQGRSILYLADDEAVQAIVSITDPLRNHAEQFIIQARESGIDNFIILSGDNQKSVAAIAQRLGIDEVHGDLLPDEKLQWLLDYQAQKSGTEGKVLMFGDGINDAPTLAAADVSMSFSDATDLAKNQCDFIMLGKGYELLASGFQLMRKTRKIILQNLGWAIGYNILVIPAAVMGYVTPWMAAIGMSLSSLLVIANSLRINK